MESKKEFIEAIHNHKIFIIEKGDHKGAYKTYVDLPDGRRKPIERKSYDMIISALCDYYRGKIDANMTLQDGFEELMKRKKNKGRVQSTIDNNRYTFRRFTTNKLARKALRLISEDDIYDSVREKLDGISPSMRDIRSYLQILNGIYKLARGKHIVRDNPVELIEAEDFKACIAPGKAPEERMFTEPQKNALLSELEGKEPNPRAFAIELSAWTGMRSGELPCLTWDDVDDDNGFIHVHRSMQIVYSSDGKGRRTGFRTLEYTKNEKGISEGGRFVPILPETGEILDRIRQHQQDIGLVTDRIICEDDGSEVTNKSIEKYMGRVCRRLSLPATGIHSLRRTFNTVTLMDAGLTVVERAAILGHSPEVDERYYLIASKDAATRARSKMLSNRRKGKKRKTSDPHAVRR